MAKKNGTAYQAPYTPYCIVDNVLEEDTVSEILSNLSEEKQRTSAGNKFTYRELSEGPAGIYALFYIGESYLKQPIKSLEEMKFKGQSIYNILNDAGRYYSFDKNLTNQRIDCYTIDVFSEYVEPTHPVLYYEDLFGNYVLIPLD